MPAHYRLIGHPLGHSLSPFIHKRLFALSGRDTTYELFDIDPASFDTDFPALLRQVDGLNVTIPYKQKVQPFLNELAPSAALCRAVNCIAVTENGVIGHNTDVDGFVKALEAADIPLRGRVLVAGVGGAGGMFAIKAALSDCEVVLYKPHHLDKAETLAAAINADYAPRYHCTATAELPAGEFDLLINATPVGMYPHINECPLPDTLFSHSKAAFDAIYNPRETVFLQKAAANGAKTAGGMAMLVWQAVVSHTIWYNASFDERDITALIDDCYDELRRFA